MPSLDGRFDLGVHLEGLQKIHHAREPAIGECLLNNDPKRWATASRILVGIEPGQQAEERPDAFEELVDAHMEVVHMVYRREFPEVEVLWLDIQRVARLAELV